jgi:hypothetical protein
MPDRFILNMAGTRFTFAAWINILPLLGERCF